MTKGGWRVSGVGMLLLVCAPGGALAETWEPLSRTATAITGPVVLSADRIAFGNGSGLALSRVGERASFKADGRTVRAELYKVSGGDPVLRQGNRLCGTGQRPTYLAVWDDTSVPGQKARTMAVYAEGAVPDGDASACATFGYVVKAGAPHMPAAKTPAPAKAEIPARFRGVWAFVAQRTGECRASEWKGIAASDESLVEIGPTALVAFESGCDVTGVKRSDGPVGEGPTTMAFTCSGEGSTETVRETWDIVRHKGDELLVTSQIGKPRIVAYMRCR